MSDLTPVLTPVLSLENQDEKKPAEAGFSQIS
jgi:hypothetical protein